MAVSYIPYRGVKFNGEISGNCRVRHVTTTGSGNDARLRIEGGADMVLFRPILVVYSSQTGDILMATIIEYINGEYKKIHLAGQDYLTSLEVSGSDLVSNKKYWNYGQGFAIGTYQNS